VSGRFHGRFLQRGGEASSPPVSERLSNRFLRPKDLQRNARPSRSWGPYELFADGQWQDIRASLERQGWNCSQIELMHDQLRQGWPLPMAKHNVATLTGHCPLRARQQS